MTEPLDDARGELLALADECERIAKLPIEQMPIYQAQGRLKEAAAALRSDAVNANALRQTIADEWGSHLCFKDSFGKRSCGEDDPALNCRCWDIANAIMSQHGATLVPTTSEVGREESPDDIRALGWMVAVHNDYRTNGERHTFWLFTKDARALKGEGRTDADALNQVRAALSQERQAP